MAVMYSLMKKYSIKEYSSYTSAGKIVQESLSSIRTVLTFGLEKKIISNYSDRLTEAEKICCKKGNI